MFKPATRRDPTSRPRSDAGVRVLLADDDDRVRTLYAMVLGEIDGVGSVVAAADGAEAVQLATGSALDAAVLDFMMPRLDGIEAALQLTALQPRMAIALHSSDPEVLRSRACGLDLALFGKAEFDRLIAWVEREVVRRQASHSALPAPMVRDRRCASCGYGVASEPPARCPMCGSKTEWTVVPARRASTLPAG